MIELIDIYSKVGMKLAMQNFDFATVEEKKQLVDDNLKTYLIEKVSKINGTSTFVDSKNAISVEELVNLLGELIPTEKHFDTLRHLTHFILNIAGEMQMHSIVWYSKTDQEFVDKQEASFDSEGKWDSLTTHQEHSYVQTFHQVYGIFKEVFMAKSKTIQLEMKRPKLLENSK